MTGLVNKKGKLNVRGRLVASTIGALVGWYITGPLIEKALKKVAS